ncbi:MAG: PIN domain nuclease [Nitrospinae bacterium]|nr:PIN domain nuclease [Nitrospinota bacterium]
MILVDTSVWIDFFRGVDSPHRKALHRLIEADEDMAITEIIMTEILQGVKDERQFQTVKQSLMTFPVLRPKGIETYIEAARIYKECRKKGKTVRKTIDCIIAAICMENNLALFHKDSDFDFIKACAGLKCYEVPNI